MQILIVGAFKKIRSDMLENIELRVAPATTDCSGTFAGAIIVPRFSRKHSNAASIHHFACKISNFLGQGNPLNRSNAL